MSHPQLEELIKTIHQLRHPDTGCPWDLKQTHQSLLKFLIEECYEFIAACEKKSTNEMEEELGDILLQVLLHSEIASEEKTFNLESVAKKLNDKMIRRHPHVFNNSDGEKISSDKVVENWNKIKSSEKKPSQQYFDESYLHFPALFSANKIGKKTHDLSFDWEDAAQVSYKVEEEWQELKEEMAPLPKANHQRIYEEMGDFLFSAAQLARHLNIDPEQALRDANKKFIRRFTDMDLLIKKDGKEVEDLDQSQMDQYWNMVKTLEKK